MLTLDGFRNNSALTKISGELMVTQGEWALKHLDVSVFNLNVSQNVENSVCYTVKEPLTHVHTSVCLSVRLWFLVSSSRPVAATQQSRQENESVCLQVTIRRKPMLYVVNLIVPLFYLLVLDVASFFIHASKGEKLSFKITVLLSISVLLLILQDMLPSTEDNLPMIGGWVGGRASVEKHAHTRTHTHLGHALSTCSCSHLLCGGLCSGGDQRPGVHAGPLRDGHGRLLLEEVQSSTCGSGDPAGRLRSVDTMQVSVSEAKASEVRLRSEVKLPSNAADPEVVRLQYRWLCRIGTSCVK